MYTLAINIQDGEIKKDIIIQTYLNIDSFWDRNKLGWLSHVNPPCSLSQVLGLQTYATTPTSEYQN